LITQMPLTREVSRVTVFLEKLGNRWCGLRQTIGVARNHHDREGRADWIATGHEGGPAGGAACLTIPACEYGAFSGDAINGLDGRIASNRYCIRLENGPLQAACATSHGHSPTTADSEDTTFDFEALKQGGFRQNRNFQQNQILATLPANGCSGSLIGKGPGLSGKKETNR
jgi:hypothetical protein